MLRLLTPVGRRATRRRDDRGETLIELLITTVIMSIAVVAIVGAIATAIRVSDTHRKQATAGAAVRDFAEALQAKVAAGGYVGCATTSTYPVPPAANPVYTAPAGYTAKITAVAYWVTAPVNAFQQTCPTTAVAPFSQDDSGILRLSLQVESNDHRATENLDVVLRQPCRTGETCTL